MRFTIFTLPALVTVLAMAACNGAKAQNTPVPSTATAVAAAPSDASIRSRGTISQPAAAAEAPKDCLAPSGPQAGTGPEAAAAIAAAQSVPTGRDAGSGLATGRESASTTVAADQGVHLTAEQAVYVEAVKMAIVMIIGFSQDPNNPNTLTPAVKVSPADAEQIARVIAAIPVNAEVGSNSVRVNSEALAKAMGFADTLGITSEQVLWIAALTPMFGVSEAGAQATPATATANSVAIDEDGIAIGVKLADALGLDPDEARMFASVLSGVLPVLKADGKLSANAAAGIAIEEPGVEGTPIKAEAATATPALDAGSKSECK